ncbi:MAG TPA: YdcF family protein [Kamptonema sp.]|nr:YdcF family protein [Kamptonema sp.]
MFVLLSRIIVLLLIIFLVKTLWDQAGGKESVLLQRLLILLIVTLAVLSFFAPDSTIGSAVLSVLSFILKPLGFSITLLVGATALITSGGGIKNPAPRLILLALLILILSSTPIIAFWLAERAEGEAVQAIQIDACCRETGGAIVLLGQGTTQPHIPNRVSIQLTATGDRIPFAAILYKRRLAPYVIVSAGPRSELNVQVSEAKDIRSLLVSMGVPHDRIILEERGFTVHSSAEEVKKILAANGLGRKVILVTSAIEIRRASLTFAEVGIKVIPRATSFYSFQSTDKFQRRIGGGDFFPNAEALFITTRIIDEYLAFLYYFLRGWLAPSI